MYESQQGQNTFTLDPGQHRDNNPHANENRSFHDDLQAVNFQRMPECILPQVMSSQSGGALAPHIDFPEYSESLQ